MFRNMAVSLIEHEVIKTTVPKAKELKRVAEPLITLAKSDSVANRRLAFARTGDKAAVGKLFGELGPRYQDRPGGYTRILKCGYRAGDAAPMAYIELVDRPLPDNDEDFDDDFEDDDDLLAAIRQVEDKVKQEQDYEKILKEREEELNLELMLVDVDPNEC